MLLRFGLFSSDRVWGLNDGIIINNNHIWLAGLTFVNDFFDALINLNLRVNNN